MRKLHERHLRHASKGSRRIIGGGKAYKRITIKVFMPEGLKDIPFFFRAPAQRFYSEKDVENTLDQVVTYLEQRFPVFEFRMLQLDPNRFHFVFDHVREETVAQIGKKMGVDLAAKAGGPAEPAATASGEE